MPAPRSSLASIATRLEELTERVTEAANDLSGSDDETVAAALYEVERSLRAATRRLAAVVRELG